MKTYLKLGEPSSGDPGAVAKAKANIEEHFVVVGLLEKVSLLNPFNQSI